MSDQVSTSQRPRVLSGMRPTGKLHLGNYMGALANWVKLQDNYECYFFIADLHALTTDYSDTSGIEPNTREVALDFLAAGLDPERSTIFIQSQVKQHYELPLLLGMITPLGWLERVPSYKEMQENLASKDLTTYGFLGYPVLMASDILLYQPQYVPVGQDQQAHVELTRDIARRFNFFYPRHGYTPAIKVSREQELALIGDMDHELAEESLLHRHESAFAKPALSEGDTPPGNILPEPRVLLTHSPKLPGTDGRKMSKSYGNTIGLSDSPIQIFEKLEKMSNGGQRSLVSDPGNPDNCPVFDLHKVFSTTSVIDESNLGCRTAAITCRECKRLAAESINAHLEPIRLRRAKYESRPGLVDEILKRGAQTASERAEETMRLVREAMKLSHAFADIGLQASEWLDVRFIVNTPSPSGEGRSWDECLPLIRDVWQRRMLPYQISLRTPKGHFEEQERALEEPLVTSSGKRVLLTVSDGPPQKVPGEQVETWSFRVPKRSYEVWVLLIYRGEQLPLVPGYHGDAEISDLIVPQKYFSQEFAAAKKSMSTEDKVRVRVMRQHGTFFLSIGASNYRKISDLHRNYEPLK